MVLPEENHSYVGKYTSTMVRIWVGEMMNMIIMRASPVSLF